MGRKLVGAVRWGRRPVDGGVQKGVGGPLHEVHGFGTGETGNIGEPDECLDTDGAADSKGQLMHLLIGQVGVQRGEGLGDPRDASSLTQGQRAWSSGPIHCPQKVCRPMPGWLTGVAF